MGTTQLEPVQEPKYRHLKTLLDDALDSEFVVGEILPNERDLAARFGVARATLRQALEQLELEGRLQRRRGVGTTVAPPRMGVSIGPSAEVGDAWRAAGCVWQVPPAAVAGLLGVPAGEPVHTVSRVRTMQGQPVATELLYVPGAEASDDRPAAVLQRLDALGPEAEDRTVELGSARDEDAKWLDRLPGAPVLVVTTRYLAAGEVVAVAVATYRADTCRLTFGDSGALEITHGPGPGFRAS